MEETQANNSVKTFHVVSDAGGNVTNLLESHDDGSLTMANSYEYGPFGQIVSSEEAVEMPYQFNTKYTDSETGLVYYGYRFYDSADGRWLNRDPIGVDGGINLYNSVSNNMVNGFSGGLSQSGGMNNSIGYLVKNYRLDSYGEEVIYIIVEDFLSDLAKKNFGGDINERHKKVMFDKIREKAYTLNGQEGIPKNLQVKVWRAKNLKHLKVLLALGANKGDHVIIHAHDDTNRHIVINSKEKFLRIPKVKGHGFDKIYDMLVKIEVTSYTMSFCFTDEIQAYEVKKRLKASKTQVYYTNVSHERDMGDFGVFKRNGKWYFDPTRDNDFKTAPDKDPLDLIIK